MKAREGNYSFKIERREVADGVKHRYDGGEREGVGDIVLESKRERCWEG